MPKPAHPLQNPESGNHPLPDDPREIEAVLRTVRRCYDLHPYFALRYGRRGEAFCRSDGGYLATLANHSLSYVIEQVVWVATVLANRGMPRWLMEVHLELLVEELSAAVAARTAAYGKLGQAAQMLRETRQALIGQADFDVLAADFEVTAGGELANAGGLIVAAVCDEQCGLAQAVPSLTGWLGDSNRFSAPWCAAVTDTLARARALAGHVRSP